MASLLVQRCAARNVAQLARAFLGALDRRPVAAARQHDDARARARRCRRLGHRAHRLRRRDAVLVAGDEQRRRLDVFDGCRVALGERLAAARVAVAGPGASGSRARRRRRAASAARVSAESRRLARAPSAISCIAAAPAARLRGARADRRARRLGRRDQRAEQGEAAHQRRVRRREVLADDGAHRMADQVRARRCPAGVHTDSTRVDVALDRQRPARARCERALPGRSMRTTRWPRERRHQRRPGVAAAAEAVHADDGVALAFVLDGDACR